MNRKNIYFHRPQIHWVILIPFYLTHYPVPGPYAHTTTVWENKPQWVKLVFIFSPLPSSTVFALSRHQGTYNQKVFNTQTATKTWWQPKVLDQMISENIPTSQFFLSSLLKKTEVICHYFLVINETSSIIENKFYFYSLKAR